MTFLSNIFPIPNTVQKQIETNIFRHTWQFSKREPIARKKTLFWPKEVEGIELIQPEYHSLAMRPKHFLKLKEKDNQERQILFTRYNLATVYTDYTDNFDIWLPTKTEKLNNPKLRSIFLLRWYSYIYQKTKLNTQPPK